MYLRSVLGPADSEEEEIERQVAARLLAEGLDNLRLLREGSVKTEKS